MRMRLPISMLAISLAFATAAGAQLSLTPPALQTPATKPVATQKLKPHTIAKKPAAPEAKPAAPEAKPAAPAAKPPPPAATVTPAPAPQDPNVDLVYGAYQRGQYKTAFDLASARAQVGDVKAMTVLGELYANAQGVKRDYAKADDWYKRAADGGDREAMFELAMMRIAGRGGAGDKQEGAKLLG